MNRQTQLCTESRVLERNWRIIIAITLEMCFGSETSATGLAQLRRRKQIAQADRANGGDPGKRGRQIAETDRIS
jgi:hypothetical protein